MIRKILMSFYDLLYGKEYGYYEVVKKHREKERETFQDGSFSKVEYELRIKYIYRNLDKYMSQVNFYLKNYYEYSGRWTKYKFKVLFGEKYLDLLMSKQVIDIDDIYKIYKYFNLKKDFLTYFSQKTHFSYGFTDYYFKYVTPKQIIRKMNKDKEEKYKLKIKLSEFVFIILSEYISLHNYMWSSKLKPKEVNCLDDWIEPMSRECKYDYIKHQERFAKKCKNILEDKYLDK